MYNHVHSKWAKLKLQLTCGLCIFVIGRILCEMEMAVMNAKSSCQHLTDIQVAKCLALAKSRMKQPAIATEIGWSKSTIGWILKWDQFETFV